MKYLNKWFQDKLNQKSYNLNHEISVEGIRDKHLGPRYDYAKIKLLIEPAKELEVCFNFCINENNEKMINASIFGLLDIILTIDPFPLRNIKIIFQEIDIHPIDSNIMSFRYAGIDAGIKIKKLLSN